MNDNQNFNTELAAIILFAYYVGRQAPIKQERASSMDMLVMSAQAMAEALQQIHNVGAAEC